MNKFKQRLIGNKLEQELRIKNGKIVINEISCDGCGSCVEVCPHSALAIKNLSKNELNSLPFKGRLKVRIKGNSKAYVQNYDQCTTCGLCMKQCHEFAIHKVEQKNSETRMVI